MLIVHLVVSYAHVNLCQFFSSSWCQGLAATSACGSSWTILFTFLPEIIFSLVAVHISVVAKFSFRTNLMPHTVNNIAVMSSVLDLYF